MLRIGLVSYLILTTLAGPALCCCTTTHLLASVAPPVKAERSQPIHQGHGCCHDDQATQDEHGNVPESRSGKPQQPRRPSCPCKEYRFEALVLASHHSEFTKQIQLTPQGLVEMVSSLPTAALLSVKEITQVPRECMIFPFLTAQDILRALQTFRC